MSLEAERVARAAIDDPGMPVVVFALEACEFCWAVRKLLRKLDIPFRGLDLDSAAFQAGDLGGRIRRFLQAETGAATLPQIYVGGDPLGGASDLFRAFESGELARRLAPLGITPAGVEPGFEARSLLPG